MQIEIVLHERFESIIESAAVRERRLGASIAIVPSAFEGANGFFMSARMKLLGCFCHDTPPYHVAWDPARPDPLRNASPIRVATHPAPIGLLPRILGNDTKYEVETFNSTVAAANAALQGEVDAALCNLETIRARRMAYHPVGIAIAMSWNLFLFGEESER
ncbi:hypothetical protein [Salinarimonas sp.]|uniref:hypothetical protein n=1 Tax=Salinarimonas sp. TaxID=2766526 RepID=UPI0039187949